MPVAVMSATLVARVSMVSAETTVQKITDPVCPIQGLRQMAVLAARGELVVPEAKGAQGRPVVMHLQAGKVQAAAREGTAVTVPLAVTVVTVY
ncbi:hypothetical protein LSB85_004690 [Salmonella enterica]|nr:hypothetical protein [Salmonella enterica subsp. enterica serovar Gaminara]EIP3952786.1 hypothetical protein [Salmonella enterica]